MKIGVVLSGGFARGAAQAGFLKGFLSIHPKEDIKCISSSSIGGLNALALSCNKLEYLEKMYRTKNFTSIKNLRFDLKNKLVEDIFHNLIDKTEVQIPMYMTGTCMNTLSTHYFYVDQNSTKEEVYKALDITLTFPFVNGIFKRYDKRIYLDGGALDNNPTYPLTFLDLDLIIVLHSAPNYMIPAYLIDEGRSIIDIEVTSQCKKRVSSFSFQHENLEAMFVSAEEYGKKFASAIKDVKNKDELNNILRNFKNEELKTSTNKWNSITLVELLNRVNYSRNIR